MFSNYDRVGGESVYIDRLELQGFKSFARRTTVQLGPGISGVVGPNGCGKSNIVDAIKWCLGEQSAKSLRGQVMGDVIFNGSATEKPSDFVEVSLVFHRGQSQFKGMFAGLDEVQVTRRLHRNGQSAYLLNQSKVRLKDVQLFFMDTGLYNHRYALIEQGQIGHIIEARPQQMRLLFEEAAGISHFNERRLAAEGKLHSTKENLDKVEIIVNELHRRVLSLNRQAKKAVLHLRLSSKLRQLTLAIAVSEFRVWLDERTALSAIERERLQLEEELERVTTRQWSMLVQAKQSLSTKQEVSNSLQKQLNNVVEQYAQRQTAVEYEARQIQVSQTRIAELEQLIVSAQVDVEFKEQELSGIETDVLSAENQMSEAAQLRSIRMDRHRDANRQIAETDAVISRVKHTFDIAGIRLSKIDGELTAIVQRLRDIENDLSSRQQDTSTLMEEITGYQSQIEALTTTIAQHQIEVANQRQQNEDLRDQQMVLTATLKEAKQSLQSAEQQMRSIERIIQQAETKIASTNRLIQAHDGVSNSISSVLNHDSCVGLLVSHLVIELEHQEALLTALGEDADLVVVSPEANLPEVMRLIQGRGRLFQLPLDWKQSVQHTDVSTNLGLFSSIQAPDWALYVLHHLLGRVSVDSTTHCDTLLQITEMGWAVRKYGIWSVGIVSQVAGEMLHRKRVLANEREKLETLLLQSQEQLAIVEEARIGVQVAQEGVEQTKSILQNGVVTLRDLEQQIQNRLREQKSLQQSQQRMERQLTSLQDLSVQRENERVEKLNRRTQLQAEQETLRQSREDADRQLRVHQSQRARQVQHARSCNDQKQESEQQCMVLGERLIQAKQRRDAIVIDLSKHRQRFQDAERQFQQQQDQLLELEQSLLEARDVFQALETARVDLESQVNGAIEAVKQWMDYTQKMDATVQESQHRKEVATAERVSVQKELDAVQSKISVLKLSISEQFGVRLPVLIDRLTREQQIVFEPIDGVDAIAPESDDEAVMTRPMFCSIGELLSDEQRDAWRTVQTDLKEQLSRLGTVNFEAVEERHDVQAEFERVSNQKVDLEHSVEQIQSTIAQLNATCADRFMETVQKVDANFQELYPRLVGGGSSSIELLDPNLPLETGVSILAQPPGKKLERLSLLSGGERAMVAIALLFSLFQVKPSPVCLMDEVDAPLDEANGERFNTMLQEMSTNSQFIVITHNKKTMEAVDTVYGVTMPTPGVSQLVSVRFD